MLILLFSIACLNTNTSDTTLPTRLHGWSFHATIGLGRIVPHTWRFKPQVEGTYQSAEFSVAYQTRGVRPWQWDYRYPKVGLAMLVSKLGNDAVLGNGAAVFPFVELPLAGWKHQSTQERGWALTFRFGSGFAWLSRWYNPETNPQNNVIAAPINNITQFQFSARYRLTPRWEMALNTTLTHYSSGAVRLPNLGINVPEVRLSAAWQPRPWLTHHFHQPQPLKPPEGFTGQLQFVLGFQEIDPPNGPIYHLYGAEFTAGRWLGRKQILSIGAVGHFKESSWTIVRQNGLYQDKFFLRSVAFAPLVRDDIVIGNVGVALIMGYYVYTPSPEQIKFFQRIGWYYSIPLRKNEYVKRLSFGVYLTAGSFSADYVSTELGWRF
ncbi:MAG: autotransporter outer membrane beta-barrel domain-containing protein [Chitinophagales bacterium]|nr:autotransporter outer membrane beta-barrel domain-containing protein [Chitinophagales bacterium]MDW8427110.1 autotransporter outer membrane beta-barrel domain-containing protein [Chitinophagales bacterium]